MSVFMLSKNGQPGARRRRCAAIAFAAVALLMQTETGLSSPKPPQALSAATQGIELQHDAVPAATTPLAGLLVPRNIRLIIHYSRTAYA